MVNCLTNLPDHISFEDLVMVTAVLSIALNFVCFQVCKSWRHICRTATLKRREDRKRKRDEESKKAVEEPDAKKTKDDAQDKDGKANGVKAEVKADASKKEEPSDVKMEDAQPEVCLLSANFALVLSVQGTPLGWRISNRTYPSPKFQRRWERSEPKSAKHIRRKMGNHVLRLTHKGDLASKSKPCTLLSA